MMKFATKLLVASAVVALAVSMSVAPTEAAKKHKKVAKCTSGELCSTNCSGGGCWMNVCGEDGSWHTAILTPICASGMCPKKKC